MGWVHWNSKLSGLLTGVSATHLFYVEWASSQHGGLRVTSYTMLKALRANKGDTAWPFVI